MVQVAFRMEWRRIAISLLLSRQTSMKTRLRPLCHKTAEGPIRIIKTYRFFNFLTAVKYELINIGGLPINIGGAVSFNISLSSPEHIFQPKILEKGIEFEDKSTHDYFEFDPDVPYKQYFQ